MKSLTAVFATLLVGSRLATAKEIANPAKQWKYESGLVHETIMNAKHVRRFPHSLLHTNHNGFRLRGMLREKLVLSTQGSTLVTARKPALLLALTALLQSFLETPTILSGATT
jgi:hypothetical protein